MSDTIAINKKMSFIQGSINIKYYYYQLMN